MLNALNDVNSGVMREGVPDILWTTQFAVDPAPYRNVYAELGTIFASCVITFPTVCAHIRGQLGIRTAARGATLQGGGRGQRWVGFVT